MICVSPSGFPRRATWITLFGASLLVGISLWTVRVDPVRLIQAPRQLLGVVARFLTAPDWTYLPALAALTLETFLIAFVASIAACLISFPVAMLAARNCSPHPALGLALKAVASVLRAIPDLVLALILASSVGLGNVPGVLALTVCSVAYLVKAYAEALEVVDRKPIEGVVASGGDWLGQRVIGVVPQAFPDLMGLSLYIMDSNLRSAAILGAVGAGGIGYDLASAVRHFRFDRLGIMILSVYFSVSLVDFISTAIRRRIA